MEKFPEKNPKRNVSNDHSGGEVPECRPDTRVPLELLGDEMTGFQRDVNQSHVSSTIPSTLSSRDGNEFDFHESYVDISADTSMYIESIELEEQYIYGRESDALPNDTYRQDRNGQIDQQDQVTSHSRMQDNVVSTTISRFNYFTLSRPKRIA